ncbi:MAG: hypothetical protein GX601_01595 [Anaerolineales bacterium]|nr:hypothetical protein [Anaerolineales bacterium]
MDTVNIGELSVSRLIIGGNPFSGFSHQGSARDMEMRHYYTTERIKQTLSEAQALGINTHISRADHHVMRVLLEFWDEGGALQWFAQTCPEIGTPERGIQNAINGGASACYIHGGYMDFLYAQNRLDEVPPCIDMIRAAGMPAGIAGHNPHVFEWAERTLDLDFYMCSYYNSAHRDERAEHVSGTPEWFQPEDRDEMVSVIRDLSRPVIHYKVLAAGRTPPAEAFAFVAQHLRPQDAVCVGVFTKDRPGMLAEDIRLLTEALARA